MCYVVVSFVNSSLLCTSINVDINVLDTSNVVLKKYLVGSFLVFCHLGNDKSPECDRSL